MTHCQSIRIALYRVFVRPALLNAESPRLNLHCISLAASQRRSNSSSTAQWAPTEDNATGNQESPKKRSYKDRVAEREAAKCVLNRGAVRITPPPRIKGQPDRPPQDLEIRSRHIAYVDKTGKFFPRAWRDDILKLLDTRNEHLVQVAPPDDPDDPQSLPTCRIISKVELREKAQKQLQILKEKGKADRAGKTIELNWAIAPGDLEIKVNKICAFLEEGRKVDVMVAPKKRKRKASADEMEGLLAKLEEGIARVQGAAQVTPPEGKVGGHMTFFYEKRTGT